MSPAVRWTLLLVGSARVNLKNKIEIFILTPIRAPALGLERSRGSGFSARTDPTTSGFASFCADLRADLPGFAAAAKRA